MTEPCHIPDSFAGSTYPVRNPRVHGKSERSPDLIGRVAGILRMESILVTDKKAEELEAKGLFRRAAARWSEVATKCPDEDRRERIMKRQQRCLNQVGRVSLRKNNLSDIREAAIRTEKAMGISLDRKGRRIKEADNEPE